MLNNFVFSLHNDALRIIHFLGNLYLLGQLASNVGGASRPNSIVYSPFNGSPPPYPPHWKQIESIRLISTRSKF